MSKKVLLADDSVTIQRVVEIILANGDYDLQVADNGDGALTKALADRPDIVLADVYMPGKNGYELCAAIKGEPALAGVPVVLLSGTFEVFDENKAREAGADSWIAKPFESQLLIDELESILARSASAGSAPVEAAIDAETASSAVAEPDMWTDLETGSLSADDGGDFLATVGDEEVEADEEVELEVDDLWDDEPLLGSADEPLELTDEETVQGAALRFDESEEGASYDDELASLSAATEPVEEDVLFLDESDLLIEDDNDSDVLAEEKTFEFITSDDSAQPDALAEEHEVSLEGVPASEEKLEPVDGFSEPAETFVFELEDTLGEDLAEEDSRSGQDPATDSDFVMSFEEPLPSEEQPAEESLPEPAEIQSFFSEEGLVADLSEEPEEDAVSPEADFAAAVEPETDPLAAGSVTERVQGLSEQQLTAIVEQVAGRVIERLASAVLERIAWEVVPDLAESLIREEISRITSDQD